MSTRSTQSVHRQKNQTMDCGDDIIHLSREHWRAKLHRQCAIPPTPKGAGSTLMCNQWAVSRLITARAYRSINAYAAEVLRFAWLSTNCDRQWYRGMADRKNDQSPDCSPQCYESHRQANQRYEHLSRSTRSIQSVHRQKNETMDCGDDIQHRAQKSAHARATTPACWTVNHRCY